MKLLITLIALVTILNNRVLCSETVKQQFAEVITINAMKDGDIELPIPILDSYEFDKAEFTLPGDIFNAKVNISKGSISGISSLRILELNVSSTTSQSQAIDFNILLPYLELHAEHYELVGNIYYAVPIKGKGVAHMEVHNLQFWGTLYMKLSETSNSLLFDKLENAQFHVERIVSRTEFDQNIDNIITALIEDLLADYLNLSNKYIFATYSDAVIEIINNILLELEKNN